MKIMLNLEGVGVLGYDPHNFIVGDGISKGEGLWKSGREREDTISNARYYSDFHQALKEIYGMFQKQQLGKGKPATSMAEFLARVEKAGQEWEKLTKGIIDRKPTLTPENEA